MKLSTQNIIKFIFWSLEIGVCILILILGALIMDPSYKSFTENIPITGLGIDYITPYAYYYNVGMILGLIAFILFAIALIPGILGRFGVKNKFISWLMTYRREFGKLMFLFALAHYFTIKIFPMIALNLPLDFPLYQTFGFLTLVMATLLFITSNNFSQKKLGKYWKSLHSLVYIMVWTLFMHIALRQGFSLISSLVFILAFAEIMSLANYYLFRLNLNTAQNLEAKL